MRLAIACIAAVLSAGAARSQSADWDSLFKELVSPDQQVSGRARDLLFTKIIPVLEAKSPADLERDIEAMLNALDSDDQRIRIQASGLLAGLAMRREDGHSALLQAIPTLVRQFSDSNGRVRQNAVRSVSVLRPTVPEESLPALQTLVRDQDQAVAHSAIFGIGRLAAKSKRALDVLSGLLAESEPPATRRFALRAAGFNRLGDPTIVEGIRSALKSADRELAAEAVKTSAMIGPSAQALRDDIERIANGQPADELAQLAKKALNGLDRK